MQPSTMPDATTDITLPEPKTGHLAGISAKSLHVVAALTNVEKCADNPRSY